MRRSLVIKAATATATLALSAQATADAAFQNPRLPEQVCAPAAAAAAPAPAAEPAPVLLDGLGFAGIEADSDDPRARAWFAQGVRLIWAFDEVEAVRAFREAQRIDPACALCFFGESWALSPTINLGPRAETLAARRAAAGRAAALAGGLSERDRTLIRAMVLRHEGDDIARGTSAYAAFMERAALRLSQDDTIQVLAADARMQAADSFQPGSLTQRLLERVLARSPGHGGAIHFYIHLTDWIDRQHLAAPHADRLGAIAPAASHLVHMPSHSYYGVGRYRDAAAVNVAAIAADRAFAERARPLASDYRVGLLAHNMHFAMNSALARGDGETARDVAQLFAARFLAGDPSPRYRFLGSSVLYTAGLHAPIHDVMRRALPAGAIERAFHHYARGEAQARDGDPAAVRAEAEAIAALRTGSDAPAFTRGAGALATIFEHVLKGRAAMIAGDFSGAASAYRTAMTTQLEAGFGSDPPLFWYSVRRSLAAALLAAGDAEGARRQLFASLRAWPGDPLALYTLSLADRRLGDGASADRNLARARAGWAGEVTLIPLARI